MKLAEWLGLTPQRMREDETESDLNRYTFCMERDSICRSVDEIIVDMTAFEGFNFPRNELTVEAILGWLPSDLTEEPQLTIVTERADQWVNPPVLAHLPDPSDSFRTRCGKYQHMFSSLQSPEARHVMWVSGPKNAFNICAECISKQ